MKKIITPWILAFLLLTACQHLRKASETKGTINSTTQYEINKKIVATRGAVVCAHPLASEAGVLMMKKGGNAIDAAVATQLALAVVYPNAGNIGGGGFMVAHLANGENITLDYRETAPSRAHKDMYLDGAGNPIDGKSRNGHLSAGVPGTIAGLFASMPYAKLKFSTLIEPAILLAEKGFAITEKEAIALNEIQDDLNTYNTQKSALQKTVPWKKGDLLIQKDLAETLKRVQKDGQKGFYEGKTAELIVAEMKRADGVISMEDLKNYTAKKRVAHIFPYKGYEVVSMPLPSSGGIILNQVLKMVENRNIDKMNFHSPAAVQLMVEAERRAYADRAEYMGDADFYKVPVATLTDNNYIQSRMRDYNPSLAGTSAAIKAGKIDFAESEETTHLSVIDNEGNAVSVTTTLNNSYGSKTVVGGAGFLLNDEMDDFSIKPGVPNMYGAVGSAANAIMPGKRMLSSMAPIVILKDKKPNLVIGSPGGTTIPTSVFQTVVNILDFNMSVSDAINKPKFHHQWLPDVVFIEPSFPESIAQELEKMGYKIVKRGPIGRTEVIKVLPDGRFEAVADNRGDDSAAGF